MPVPTGDSFQVSSLTITGQGGGSETRQAQFFKRFVQAGLTRQWYHGTLVLLYQGGTMPHEEKNREPVVVERVQTGVRMEKRLLKVLKAIAELKDLSLGDLLEGIVLHAFEGKLVPFSPQTLKEIEQFKSIYGMTLKASDSHNLKERKK
jgi:hypothetical protein